MESTSRLSKSHDINTLAIPSAAENVTLFLKQLFKIMTSHCDPIASNLGTANNYAANMSIMN